MFTSEFKEPSAIMQFVRCRRCFQVLSPMKVCCPRCGNFDRARVGKAITALLLGTTAVIGAIGIVFLAVLGQNC
jgi:hypothetical protein